MESNANLHSLYLIKLNIERKLKMEVKLFTKWQPG